ncbi:MAG: cytochrome c-type biosis protein [Clostridiales bacterium]|jgi:cytochrome c-type biogenesis protein|nr:cytochrome c-type biosis protein [Clostridiales bacterium]MDN5297587.1 cytochrome c-type biosis protein [Clostridiales bacterium]
MIIQVNAWAAFTAGIASFFSPCLLPLIPAYIMYLTGSYDVEDIKLQRRKAIIQTLGFILGFTIVFILMGVTASAVGKLFASNKAWLSRLAGVFILFFGLNMLGILKLPFMHQDYRKQFVLKKTTPIYAVGMGMAFAFGWTPCFGPIIGAILASTTAFSRNVSEGVYLLTIYSLGMAIPFLLTAIFIDFVQNHLVALNKHMSWLNKVAGFTLCLLGLLMLLGKLGPLVSSLFNL